MFSLSALEVANCVNIPKGPCTLSPAIKFHQESWKCLQHDNQRAAHSKREFIWQDYSQYCYISNCLLGILCRVYVWLDLYFLDIFSREWGMLTAGRFLISRDLWLTTMSLGKKTLALLVVEWFLRYHKAYKVYHFSQPYTQQSLSAHTI